jgi:hypothetical protein
MLLRIDIIPRLVTNCRDMELVNITPRQLRKAAKLQERIQGLQKELGQLLGRSGETAATQAPRRRKISAAGIARIVAATKARWARIRAAKRGAKAIQKPRRKLSATGRARLVALAKARWAKAKKAGRSRL